MIDSSYKSSGRNLCQLVSSALWAVLPFPFDWGTREAGVKKGLVKKRSPVVHQESPCCVCRGKASGRLRWEPALSSVGPRLSAASGVGDYERPKQEIPTTTRLNSQSPIASLSTLFQTDSTSPNRIKRWWTIAGIGIALSCWH